METGLSVIMAVKNEINYLPEAVQSILKQTFKNFEFIIVDDNSDDGTAEYLKELKDPRLVVLSNKGSGQTQGLNQALFVAKGTWIARMDGDDWSFPTRFENQMKLAHDDKNVVLITADYLICDDTLKPISPIKINPDCPGKVFSYFKKRNNPFCHPLVMFRKDVAASVGGYDEKLRNAQDYRLWKDLLEKGEWRHCSEILLKYRVRKQSLSVLRAPEQEQERKMILEKSDHLSALPVASQSAIEGLYAYKLGFAAWMGGRRIVALRFLLKAIINGSRPLKSAVLIISSILPRSLYLALGGYRGVFR